MILKRKYIVLEPASDCDRPLPFHSKLSHCCYGDTFNLIKMWVKSNLFGKDFRTRIPLGFLISLGQTASPNSPLVISFTPCCSRSLDDISGAGRQTLTCCPVVTGCPFTYPSNANFKRSKSQDCPSNHHFLKQIIL